MAGVGMGLTFAPGASMVLDGLPDSRLRDRQLGQLHHPRVRRRARHRASWSRSSSATAASSPRPGTTARSGRRCSPAPARSAVAAVASLFAPGRKAPTRADAEGRSGEWTRLGMMARCPFADRPVRSAASAGLRARVAGCAAPTTVRAGAPEREPRRPGGQPVRRPRPVRRPGLQAPRRRPRPRGDGDADARQRVFTRLAGDAAGHLADAGAVPRRPGRPVRRAASSHAADEAGQVPTFVVYGIPDRDCTGQLLRRAACPPTSTARGCGEIADAAGCGRRDAAVVVEPDALASPLECGDRDERVGLIADAVDRLAAAGVTTYIDGGHSHWIDPDELAPLLRGGRRRRRPRLRDQRLQLPDRRRRAGVRRGAERAARRRALHHRQRPQRLRRHRRLVQPARAGVRHRARGGVGVRRAPGRLRLGEAAGGERRRVQRRPAGRSVLGRADAGAGRRVRLVRRGRGIGRPAGCRSAPLLGCASWSRVTSGSRSSSRTTPMCATSSTSC